MKMERIVSSETSAIRTQTPGNYPKRNKLHLEHGESLKTSLIVLYRSFGTRVKQSRIKDSVSFILLVMMALENGTHTCNAHVAV